MMKTDKGIRVKTMLYDSNNAGNMAFILSKKKRMAGRGDKGPEKGGRLFVPLRLNITGIIGSGGN